MKQNEQNKDSYAAPQCEVAFIASEGIVCASGGGVDPGNIFPGETEDNWT